MTRLLFLALLSLPFTLSAADVTGTWIFEVETQAGSGTPTFVFKQEGTLLTGTYSGALGEAKVKGTVDGDKIDFSFEADLGGTTAKVRYTGTIESASKMKGKAQFGELGDGTFTGTKKQ
jgi:hypothetical protein